MSQCHIGTLAHVGTLALWHPGREVCVSSLKLLLTARVTCRLLPCRDIHDGHAARDDDVYEEDDGDDDDDDDRDDEEKE